MDKISADIVTLIVDQFCHGDKSSLTCYASISSTWQHAVESRNFAHIKLYSTEIPTFSEVFARYPNRRTYLRQLDFYIVLPEPGVSGAQRSRNQWRFRTAVKSLLTTLNQWENEGDAPLAQTNATLDLSFQYAESDKLRDKHSETLPPIHDNISDPEYAGRFLRLSNIGDVLEVPKIRRVRTIWNDFVPPFALHASAICQTAGLFTLLEELSILYVDPDIPLRKNRLEHRMDLARGLESLCGELPRLRQLDIWANHSHWLKDHNFIHQDFTDEQGFDPLCEAIRKLSQTTVVKLSVEGIAISADLFKNRRQHATGDKESWESLQNLSIRTCLMGSNGKWFLTGDASSRKPELVTYESSESEYDEEDDHGDDSNESDNDEEVVKTYSKAFDDWEFYEKRHEYADQGPRVEHTWRDKIDPDTLGSFLGDYADTIVNNMPYLHQACLGIGEDEAPFVTIRCQDSGHPTRPNRRWWKVEWCNVVKDSLPDGLEAKWDDWAGETGMIEMECLGNFHRF